MKREKGRTVQTIDGEEKRFVVMPISCDVLGLYDAEIDDIILTEKLVSIYDDNGLYKLTDKFKAKIEELEKGEK